MNESVSQLSGQLKSTLSEINNNLDWMRRKNDSQVSLSSASSYQSDSSEETSSKLVRKASLQDIIQKTEDKTLLTECKRGRSMSDGAAVQFRDDDPLFEVFPSLPNSVLEKMGLFGKTSRGCYNEEELEQKFTSLALAFAIDASTTKDRCERQKRYRNQTESNLSKEIYTFKEKLALMHPLCTDYEKAELLSALFSQTDIILKATSLVSTAAERYGSVQHEERLGESVHLMVSHVQMLKQQRDSARRQLHYTKRVLQTSPESPLSSPTNNPKLSLGTITNRKIICKRRASIATISQQIPENQATTDMKKVLRRTSDLSMRASSLTRNGRPTRLELGGELLKIKEGFVEPPSIEQNIKESDSDTEVCLLQTTPESPPPEDDIKIPNNSTLKEIVESKLKRTRDALDERCQKWSDDGTLHEVCCFCALLCFSFSLLLMVNILVEYEYAKWDTGPPQFLWTIFSIPNSD